MPTETVNLEWVGDQEFLLRDRGGFTIRMTKPDGVNGADLLPLSVIGCSAWDVAAILRKQRQHFASLQVTATSVRDDASPWRFRRIQIHYRIGGRDLNDAAVQRAIAVNQERYCATYATLRDAVEISSDYEIVPAGEIPAPIEPGGVILAPEAPAGDASDAVRLFNDALNSGDLDSMMELMAEDCTFENTYPAPDGARFQGRESIRKFWLDFFQGSQNPHIAVEELISMGERCVMRWVYTWSGPDGQAGRVRGVDIYRVREGRIHEKLSYVKG